MEEPAIAATIKDIVSMMDTQKHGTASPDPGTTIPSAEAMSFAEQMMQELMGKKPNEENTDGSNSQEHP